MRAVTWQEAFTLLYADRCIVIAYSDYIIRSSHDVHKVPSIVRMQHKAPRSAYPMHIRASKGNIYLRDKGTCQYCGVFLTRDKATFDHIIPKSKGGPFSWRNVVVCCWSCNQRKGDRTPAEACMTLRNVPQRPYYLPDARPDVLNAEQVPEEWLPYLLVK